MVTLVLNYIGQGYKYTSAMCIECEVPMRKAIERALDEAPRNVDTTAVLQQKSMMDRVIEAAKDNKLYQQWRMVTGPTAICQMG